jgi:hypothetical protein
LLPGLPVPLPPEPYRDRGYHPADALPPGEGGYDLWLRHVDPRDSDTLRLYYERVMKDLGWERVSGRGPTYGNSGYATRLWSKGDAYVGFYITTADDSRILMQLRACPPKPAKECVGYR